MNTSAVIIQKNIRRFLNNKKLSSKKDNMTINMVEYLLDNYIKTTDLYNNINKKLSKKKIRNPNFPSEISENIVKFAFFKKYKIIPSWDTDKGDLIVLNKKLEVKGFMSSGPSSFGPTEDWDFIYFIDCIQYKNKYFTVYEIKLSNKNELWKNIKMNKNQTYYDQCQQKRRPHINFELIKNQLNDYCKIIFEGELNKLY